MERLRERYPDRIPIHLCQGVPLLLEVAGT